MERAAIRGRWRRLPGGLVATKMCVVVQVGKVGQLRQGNVRRLRFLRLAAAVTACAAKMALAIARKGPLAFDPHRAAGARLAAGRPVQRRLHRVVLLAE